MMHPTLLLLLVSSSESLHVQKTGETSGRGCILGLCVWSDPHNTAAQAAPKTDKEIYTDLAMQIDAERKQLEMDMTPNCFLGHWCEDTQAIKVRHEKRIQELEMSQRALAEQYGSAKQYQDDKETKDFEKEAEQKGAESEKALEDRNKAAAKKEKEEKDEYEKTKEQYASTKDTFASGKFGEHSTNQAKDIEIMRGKDAPERRKSEQELHAASRDVEQQEFELFATNPDNWGAMDTFLHNMVSRWNNLFSAPPSESNSIGHSTPAPMLSKKEVLASDTRPEVHDDHDHDHDDDDHEVHHVSADGLAGSWNGEGERKPDSA